MYCTPMMFQDGVVRVFNAQYNQWEVVTPLSTFAQPAAAVPQLFQARATSQPPVVSTGSNISESVAENVLAQPSAPEFAELPTKARTSCPVVEEEEEVIPPPPQMTFLSSQDRVDESSELAESESGTASYVDPVDLSSEDFSPLTTKKQEITPTPTTTSSATIEVQNYLVSRRVQVRAGPSSNSENVCVLTPGQRVAVVKTISKRTKTGFVTTKAYVLSNQGQGWVSLIRQHKKTDETFVFKGQASAGMKRLIRLDDVWSRHDASVIQVRNANTRTIQVRVTCPTFMQMEALRSDLKNTRLQGKTLINKQIPQLCNLKRVFGNAKPTVHVFDIDTDESNSHAEFLDAFDWSNQYRGSRKDFQHQVLEDLRQLHFGGVRNVSWAAGHTSSGRFSMRDFCTVEFNNDSQLCNFVKNFGKYDFFQGAKVKVDPIYANLTTIPATSVMTNV